jgi:pyridoxamine 5'-phosphate oxidase
MAEQTDPIAHFQTWLAEAEKSEPVNPTACSLATADKQGRPSARMVLLKGVDDRGFVFYSNLESRKGRDLAENPKASLCFYWKSLLRQVRIDGDVEPVSSEEADAYFASRARDSQIGAWASKQSAPMATRFDLEKMVAKSVARFGLRKIPRPDFWSGYRVRPSLIEFWREKPFRLHERIEYSRDGDGWQSRRLFP